MMEHCIEKTVNWLIEYEAIEKNDQELYEYAIYNLILTIYPTVFAIIIGVLIGSLRESLIIILSFMLIRKFSGGFHTNSAKSCMCISCVLMIVCVKAVAYLNCGTILTGFTILSMLCLAILSPIDSENRRLEFEEKVRNKYATIVILVLLSVISAVLYCIRKETYVICIFIAIILAAGMQILYILQKIKSIIT